MKRWPIICMAALGACYVPSTAQNSAIGLLSEKEASGVPLMLTEQKRLLKLLGERKVMDPNLAKLLDELRIKGESGKSDAANDWLKTLIPSDYPASSLWSLPNLRLDDGKKIVHVGTPRLAPTSIAPKKTSVPSSGGGTLLPSSELWNGRRPEGFNPVGFLEIVGLLNLKSNSECTGTLVAPDVVLTAAHCVLGARNEEIRVLAHRRDSAQEKKCALALAERRYIRCTRVVFAPTPSGLAVHPSYLKGELQYDLALVTLSGSLPEARPARIDFDVKFSDVTLAGFGVTNLSEIATPQTLADRLYRIEVGWHSGEFGTKDTSLEWLVSPTESKSGACRGDSGGPVYAHFRDGHEKEAKRQVRSLVAVIREGTSGTCVRYVSQQTRLASAKVKHWLCGKLDRKQMTGCPKAA